MTANSSSSIDSPPPRLSINSTFNSYITCLLSSPNLFILLPSYITRVVLLLPLCTFILYLRLQRCLKTCRTSWGPTTSHSDFFTCQLVVMELAGLSGHLVTCSGIHLLDFNMLLAGFLLSKFTWFGETFFHALTCVDHYMAVVHPITYLRLKNDWRVKTSTSVCVWISCFLGIILTVKETFIMVDLCFLVLTLTVIAFCSLSVLCVLIRPAPGERGGANTRVDRLKLRAFLTILVILGVLVLRFVFGLVWSVFDALGRDGFCLIVTYNLWFNLPSSLVLPLLFLQRAGKFRCCRKNPP